MCACVCVCACIPMFCGCVDAFKNASFLLIEHERLLLYLMLGVFGCRLGERSKKVSDGF